MENDEHVKSVDTVADSDVEFRELGLREDVCDNVRKQGWEKPTPVQQLCLPHTVAKRDIAGFAQTGTGKTGVFLISILNRFLESGADAQTLFAIVMVPTRELAMQIEQDAQPLFKGLGISCLSVFGGVDYEKQAKQIRAGTNVIVATPGRLKDYLEKKVFSLDSVELFVCDEADRMMDMGFIGDVEYFFEKLNESCQKLLFSATTNENVKELAFEYLEKPEYVEVNQDQVTPDRIDQRAFMVDAPNKLKVLLGLIKDEKPECAVVFVNTKLVAEWLHFKLNGNDVKADIITGDLPQRKRIKLIRSIKQGNLNVLIATDVASRGLHIANLSHVFNFDLPDDPANYVHRIGRTARRG